MQPKSLTIKDFSSENMDIELVNNLLQNSIRHTSYALQPNLQMIWFSFANLKGSINLFHEKKTDKLMRKCEAGKGKAKIGLLEQLLREAERATDEKGYMALSLNTNTVNLFREFL